MSPCKCPLCRNPMRNLPHGSRSWHCCECGETATEGYLTAWLDEREDVRVQRLDSGPRMLPPPAKEVDRVAC